MERPQVATDQLGTLGRDLRLQANHNQGLVGDGGGVLGIELGNDQRIGRVDDGADEEVSRRQEMLRLQTFAAHGPLRSAQTAIALHRAAAEAGDGSGRNLTVFIEVHQTVT